MATKPTKIPDIWATDDDYIVGPKFGQPTKTLISDVITAAGQGHIPGKDFPTTANEFNRWCHDISQVTKWTMEGRIDRDQSAHIAEKDMTGKLSSALAHFGGTSAAGPSLLVQENASGVSLRVEGNGNRAAEIAHSMPPGQWQPALQVESNLSSNLAGTYVAEVRGTPDTPEQGAGGLYVDADGNAAHADTDLGSAFESAVFARNRSGTGLSAYGQTSGHAARINNLLSGGDVSLYAGYSPSDSVSPSRSGYGVDGVWAYGGDGQAISGNAWDGGIGLVARGGYGNQGGVINTDGGLGLWAVGGQADSGGTGGPGILAWSGDQSEPAVIAEMDVAIPNTTAMDAPLFQALAPTGVATNLTGFEAHCRDADVAFYAFSGRRYGLFLSHAESASGDLWPHLHLGPISRAPDQSTDGDIWIEDDNATVQAKIYTDLGNVFQIPHYNDWCYAYAETRDFDLEEGGTETLEVDASYGLFHRPALSSKVIVEVNATIRPQAAAPSGDTTIQVTVQDNAGPVDIYSLKQWRFVADDPQERQTISMKFEYTNQSPGSGSFKFRLRLDPGTSNDFDITVETASIEVRAKPSA